MAVQPKLRTTAKPVKLQFKNPFGKSKKVEIKNQVATHDDSIFRKLEIEKARSHDISEQLSCHVSDVFQALGNHDVRFDFDPFSLDDCRCDFVNSREINVLCSLKHLPMESLVIEEDSVPGQVKLTLRDGFVDRFDGPSWEDVITESPSTGHRYLNTTQLVQRFSKCIAYAVEDMNEKSHEGASLVQYGRNKNTNTLFVQLSDSNTFKVNLFPSIRVNESCENFECLQKEVSRTPNTILTRCCVSECIHLVARPVDPSNSEFFRVTFNDIERRILLSDAFQCANDCFLLLKLLNDNANLLTIDEDTQPIAIGLHPYHLQNIVLREMFKLPNPEKWNRKKLPKRMMQVLKSLKDCLENGKCCHVFTDVNLFSSIDGTKLKEMSDKVNHNSKRLLSKTKTEIASELK